MPAAGVSGITGSGGVSRAVRFGIYWIVAGIKAGVVMVAVVSFVGTNAAGGCRVGPESIQFRISATEEKPNPLE